MDMFEAAKQALRDTKGLVDGLDMGLPPGAKPVPWKDQVAQFVADAPDLMAHGQRWQEIEVQHGPGAAQRYYETMMAGIFKPRERRRPLS